MKRQDVPLIKQKDLRSRNCPLCGMSIRVGHDVLGQATRYEYIDSTQVESQLRTVDHVTATKLRNQRRGRKTVALVGFSPTSCSLAPYEETEVDIWGLNEEHFYPWMTRFTGWFQIHQPRSFRREIAKRGERGHYEWLKKHRGIPIWMIDLYPEIPDCEVYPLPEISAMFLPKLRVGETKRKFFTSTYAYMVALALYKGYDRIETYGFEMTGDDEFERQKPGATFWVGLALGLGKELYFPPKNVMLDAKLYGYEELNIGDSPGKIEFI